MFTPGNQKLGGHLIWGFGLPSGTLSLCPGMTATCRQVCYAVRMQQFRPQAFRRYQENLRQARKKSFVRRVRAFLISQGIRVVRIHTGGEFYSRKYLRKWIRIIARSPRVRFFTYTRVWRIPKFQDALILLAKMPNLQLWYSADRDTGVPQVIPPRVRVAWLMTTPDDRPPAGVDLVFRSRPLRKVPLATIENIPVCPAESGYEPKPTCDRCRICWRPSEIHDESRTRHLPDHTVCSSGSLGRQDPKSAEPEAVPETTSTGH